MQNYFNYFTEIEERFQQRRGSLLMLSTLDWALIETWREAGVPLEAVLRGIDNAFDKHDAKVSRAKVRVAGEWAGMVCAERDRGGGGDAGGGDRLCGLQRMCQPRLSRVGLRANGWRGISKRMRRSSRRRGCPPARPRWRAKSLSGCGPLALRLELGSSGVA